MIAGDGPDREALERLGYGRFLGALPRRKVLELFRAGDASLLSSSWENFPHTVVEALAVGTPVIATRTGGVAEVLEDGVNGLLVEPGDRRGADRRDRPLLLRSGTRRHAVAERRRIGRRLRSGPCLRAPGADPDRGGRMTPRVLFVARDPYRLPLSPSLARKWDALSERMSLRVLASGTGSDPRFVLRPPDRARRAALLRARYRPGSLASCGTFRPDVVIAQSPYEAFAAEIACRLDALAGEGRRRGSRRLARLDAPLRLAGAAACSARPATRSPAFAVRHADAHRAVSGFTASLLRDRGARAGRRLHDVLGSRGLLGPGRARCPRRRG